MVERILSKIEFYESVPITTDFKHSPLFDTKQEQTAWFTRFRNDSLTFKGSYQRTEEQIRTPFTVEQLLNVNYVHVMNPSNENADKANSEWWGHVLDVHYIDDGLVIVDWVVDPVQTFMFKWNLGKATIERGMFNAVKTDSKKNHYLDDMKISILNNSEPIGVDGMAYALAWDNVMSGRNTTEKDVSFLVIVSKDTEVANLVGMPSQLTYYVLPYDKIAGDMFDFTINNVKTKDGTSRVVNSGQNRNHTISEAVYLLSKDESFSKAGGNIVTSYIQNEIGLAFELDEHATQLTTTLDDREWQLQGSRSVDNMDLFSLKVSGAKATGNNSSTSGGSTNSNNSSTTSIVPADREGFLKLNINTDFKVNKSKLFAAAKQSQKVQARLGNSDANIQRVYDIVKSKGMSPELFFAYELNEQGTDSGWLNHTAYTGDPYSDAESVASWAVATANSSGAVNMAWDDIANPYYSTPADKQTEGQNFANSLASGTIGRMYLAATAAACWAMFDPMALKGSVNRVQEYGDPIKGCMDLIKSWQ